MSRQKKVAIVQSSYIPWKGYFDLIAAVDDFVLFDDAQFTRRDWRNRNRIKTPEGLHWLTIPVLSKGNFSAPISEMRTVDNRWRRRHWQSLRRSYGRAPYFQDLGARFEPLYLEESAQRLSEINFSFISAICETLGIDTRIHWSMDFDLAEDRTERLVRLTQDLGADCYLSGPTASAYIDESVFVAAGVSLEYFSYRDYPTYPQLWGEFEHQVSILDLLFNTGPDANKYMQHALWSPSCSCQS